MGINVLCKIHIIPCKMYNPPLYICSIKFIARSPLVYFRCTRIHTSYKCYRRGGRFFWAIRGWRASCCACTRTKSRDIPVAPINIVENKPVADSEIETDFSHQSIFTCLEIVAGGISVSRSADYLYIYIYPQNRVEV